MRKLFLTLTAALLPFGLLAREEAASPRVFEGEAPLADSHASKVPEETRPISEQEYAAYENYPTLMLDWGLTRMRNAPKGVSSSILWSRFIDIALFHTIPLGKTGITVVPGLGMGFDTYKLSDESSDDACGYTLKRTQASRNTRLVPVTQIVEDEKASVLLDVHYLDFMLEARVNTNAKYPKEGFFAALGGKFGVFINAKTTLRYEEDKEQKERIDKESFNINKLRYGWYARCGWKRFGIKYTHFHSEFFSARGPKSKVLPHNLALSIDLF